MWSYSTSCLPIIPMTGRDFKWVSKICIQFYNNGSNDYFNHLNPLMIVKHVNSLVIVASIYLFKPFVKCLKYWRSCLCWCFTFRISARQALRHVYFKDLRDKEKLHQAFVNANHSHGVRPSHGFHSTLPSFSPSFAFLNIYIEFASSTY